MPATPPEQHRLDSCAQNASEGGQWRVSDTSGAYMHGQDTQHWADWHCSSVPEGVYRESSRVREQQGALSEPKLEHIHSHSMLTSCASQCCNQAAAVLQWVAVMLLQGAVTHLSQLLCPPQAHAAAAAAPPQAGSRP
jgi:hypothetical protein